MLALAFSEDGSFLYSGGNEGVLVQWSMMTQQKSFISRVGHSINKICLIDNYYVLTLGNNSIKVVQRDNNKELLVFTGPQAGKDFVAVSDPLNSNALMFAQEDNLQVYDVV